MGVMEMAFVKALLAILALAFTAWAAVIAWLGKGMFRRLDRTSETLQEYIVQTETRLAVIEDRLDIS
jgi:membrane protein implicated in regulation of membrane protease activity